MRSEQVPATVSDINVLWREVWGTLDIKAPDFTPKITDHGTVKYKGYEYRLFTVSEK